VIRARRLKFLSLIFSCLLLAAQYAVPGGTGESADTAAERASGKADWTVTAEATARPGDALVIRIESALPLSDPSVTLVTPEGTSLASTAGFLARPDSVGSRAPDSRIEYIALIGLPSTLSPGTYRLRAAARVTEHGGEDLRSDSPLIVEDRAFISEEIALNTENTRIKTDFGPERMAQIKALNEILFTRNQDADRFTGPFGLPVKQTRRTSEFGDRRLYRYVDGETERNVHLGVDFGIPTGSPVFAAGNGTIVLACFRISTGWTVVIEHLPGVYSLYYHLEGLDRSRGEPVRTGDRIGRSGSTGLSTGPHLHWEFRVNGVAVSPDWFVGRTLY